MERSILVAGFGGQGVMVCGQLLCYTASETTDKKVTFFPSYGSEQRGGTANCYVVISDEMIGAPLSDKFNDLIAMNDPSLDKFQGRLQPNGTLFINSSIVTKEPERTDVKVIKIPANELAFEIGNAKVANVLMVGAYIGYTDLLPEDKVWATIQKKLGKKVDLIALNEKAFKKGLELGKAAK